MTVKPAYEKEFYFFNNFYSGGVDCGAILTYTLKDHPSGNPTSSTVAVIDDVAIVPGKKRIYLKSAATVGSS